MRRLPVLALFVVLLCCACRNDNADEGANVAPVMQDATLPRGGQELIDIFALYAEGDYRAYVGECLSCRNMPETYVEQMEKLFRRHAEQTDKAHGKIKSYTLQRIESYTEGGYLRAFIRIAYVDETREEVCIPFVYADSRWWLR